jgi:uncharacterized protein
MLRNLILLLVIGFAAWAILRALKRRLNDRDSTGEKPRVEQMQACSRCGVHVPASQAIHDGEHVYCTEEHRKLGSRG